MRNEENLSSKLMSLVDKLPCFTIGNVLVSGIRENYLRIFLSRKAKNGHLVRLKKGLYISGKFIEKEKNKEKYSELLEFLTNRIYSPSYLSLDYVLYEHNLLTEVPMNFTLLTRNKTKTFSNSLGNFIYHHIKNELFLGFNVIKNNNFVICKATKMKALFDFLYLRKNLLKNRISIEELRLNLDNISKKEKLELRKYTEMEGSKAMERINSELFGE